MARGHGTLTAARHHLRRILVAGSGAAPICFTALLFLWPLAALFRRALADSGDLTLLQAWERTHAFALLGVTVGQAAASAALAVVVAAPIVWLVARVDLPGAGLLRVLVTLPFVLPTVVAAVAIRAVLTGPLAFLGLEGGLPAILLAHIFLNVAVVVRVVAAAWERIDPRAVEAARSLGASAPRAFFDVVVVRLAPAAAAAATLVFLFCATSFGVIVILGDGQVRTLETEIYQQGVAYFRIPEAAALSLLQIAVVLAALAVARLTGRIGGGESDAVLPKARPHGWLWAAVAGAAAWLALWLVWPVAVLVLRSFRPRSGGDWTLAGYRLLGESRFGNSPLASVWYSVTSAALAMVIALAVGLVTALAITRLTGPVPKIGGVLAILPLGVSAVTLGFGYLLVLTRLPREVAASPLIIPSVQALLAIPVVIGIMVPALREVPARRREAAALLGASPLRVLVTIDLPLVARSLCAAAGFAFVLAIGEFGATTFLVRSDTVTLPVLIGTLMGRPGSEALASAHAAAVLLVAVTGAVVALIELMRPGLFGASGDRRRETGRP